MMRMHAVMRAILGSAAGFGPAPHYYRRRRDPPSRRPNGLASVDALALRRSLLDDVKCYGPTGSAPPPLDEREDHDQPFIMVERLP